MSAVVALAGATVASPFVVKNDAVAKLAGRDGKPAPEMEQVVAGGFQYDMPASWGRLGAQSAESHADAQAAGTVVAGVCPGGETGAACTDGVQLTFVAYDGKHGELPLPSTFQQSLDASLPKRMAGFRKIASATGPSSDGTTWLRYEFTAGRAGAVKRELLGTFRHADGSGVVAVVTGPPAAMLKYRKPVIEFLASGASVADDEESAEAG